MSYGVFSRIARMGFETSPATYIHSEASGRIKNYFLYAHNSCEREDNHAFDLNVRLGY
jgi:hypothetical protein